MLLGGGFGVAAFDYLRGPAEEVARREALEPMRSSLRLAKAELGTAAGLIGAALRRLRGARRRDLMPLAVCATPIGNLEDVTLRVLEELAAADVVLCEDTRHTRVLLERHGIRARLLSLPRAQRGGAHGRAPAAARGGGAGRARLRRRSAGRVSDPGARLVRAALEAGVAVTVLPGRVRGRDGSRRLGTCRASSYRFVGFLPRGEKELTVLWEELRGWPWPTVAFESAEAAAGDAALARGRPSGAAGGRLP